MRNAYIAELYELVKQNKNILALISDNGAIVYDKFAADFPDNLINFGIAEATMISAAAGLAASGKIPFAYTIASFLTMRAYEQIRVDVCLQKMNVKLVGIGAGFVYSDLGPTHHCIEDIALMNVLPNMTILAPADPLEARYCTAAAAKINGPVYIRLTTGGTPKIYDTAFDFKVGTANILADGKDISIIACGSIVYEALLAVKELTQQGISVNFINMSTLKPIDENAIITAAKKTGRILTIEEHSINGGLGSIVATSLLENGISNVLFARMGLRDFPNSYGKYDYMKEINGLSKTHIIAQVLKMLKK